MKLFYSKNEDSQVGNTGKHAILLEQKYGMFGRVTEGSHFLFSLKRVLRNQRRKSKEAFMQSVKRRLISTTSSAVEHGGGDVMA